MLPSAIKDTLPNRTTFTPRAFTTGWALRAASLLDQHCPNLLNHILLATDFKRQVVFATLAGFQPNAPEPLAARFRKIAPAECLTALDPLAQIGRALIVSKPLEIIEAVRSVPEGLIGVMKRVGSQPFACPLTYGLLYDLMSRPEHRARAKCLIHVAGLITEDAVRVLAEMDGPWLRPEIICRIRSRRELDLLTDAISVIGSLCPHVPEEYLAASFERLPPRASIVEWNQRWINKASAFLAPSPIIVSNEFRVLATAATMQQAAARYRNCLRDRIGDCALGRAVFLEYLPGPALVELMAFSENRWAIESIHAEANGRVSADMIQTICSKLQAEDFLVPARFAEPALVRRVARCVGLAEFDFWECVEDYARERTTTDEVVA